MGSAPSHALHRPAGPVNGPLATLERRVAEGALASDPAQHRAAVALQDLHDRLRETAADEIRRGCLTAG